MKRHEIAIGGTYTAKVSGKLAEVRIDSLNPHGGWNATNVASGQPVRIKSAQRLRSEAPSGAQKKKRVEPPHTAPKARSRKTRAKDTGDGKMSGLDAAAKILKDSGEALDTKEMIERIFAQGLWKTGGKTPQATIYSAIIREIKNKGGDSRFKKMTRGKFSSV